MLAFMLHKGFYMAALGGACAVRAYCRLSKECYLPNQVAVEWKKPCQGRAYWWRMLAQSLYCTRLIEKLRNREFKRLTSMGETAANSVLQRQRPPWSPRPKNMLWVVSYRITKSDISLFINVSLLEIREDATQSIFLGLEGHVCHCLWTTQNRPLMLVS